jgi:predicted dehydrogenase
LSAIEIYGTEGRVMAGYPHQDIAIVKADGSAAPGFSRDEVMKRYDPRDLLAPFRELAANFAGAIQGKTTPSPDGSDGLRAIEAVEACYRSSRSGKRITLPLD